MNNTTAPRNDHFPPLYSAPTPPQIVLLDLWRVLVYYKVMIGIITLFTLAVTTLYLLFSTPVYQSEAVFLPPSPGDIHLLSVPGMREIDAKSVYTRFKRDLSSRALQRRFFNKQKLIEKYFSKSEKSKERIFEELSKLVIVRAEKNNPDALSVLFQWDDPKVSAAFANDFIRLVDRVTIDQLVSGLLYDIRNHIKKLENTIISKRAIAKKRREDDVMQLKENAMIAEELGIEPQLGVVQCTETPLYYRGALALNTEIRILQARKSDDAFIVGLRDLQEEITRLRGIKIDKTKLKAANIDQAPYAPENPTRSRKKMIMLGFILGVLLGIFAAFIRNFVNNQSRENNK